jgi:hypothetical protein
VLSSYSPNHRIRCEQTVPRLMSCHWEGGGEGINRLGETASRRPLITGDE